MRKKGKSGNWIIVEPFDEKFNVIHFVEAGSDYFKEVLEKLPYYHPLTMYVERSTMAVGLNHKLYRYYEKGVKELFEGRDVTIIDTYWENQCRKCLIIDDNRSFQLKDGLCMACYDKENFKEIRQRVSGYVYFLQEDWRQLVKIGMSSNKNFEARLASFKIMPSNTETIHLVSAVDFAGLEKLFHKHFKDKRVKGEWFKLTEEDINWVKAGQYTEEMMKEVSIYSDYFKAQAKLTIDVKANKETAVKPHFPCDPQKHIS
ncbi:GIY-YIG nuclease family protein [Peribacillus frigoritolerans]|uniref:GIY-YIG nuclease family protein n=1 Tax=Peribacillus frigoritolerans TaxID=450367 RepID=UPI002ED5701B|nr:GIY-YIG nuclease family protein [Peribacillus frigoritolerans]